MVLRLLNRQPQSSPLCLLLIIMDQPLHLAHSLLQLNPKVISQATILIMRANMRARSTTLVLNLIQPLTFTPPFPTICACKFQLRQAPSLRPLPLWHATIQCYGLHMTPSVFGLFPFQNTSWHYLATHLLTPLWSYWTSTSTSYIFFLQTLVQQTIITRQVCLLLLPTCWKPSRQNGQQLVGSHIGLGISNHFSQRKTNPHQWLPSHPCPT